MYVHNKMYYYTVAWLVRWCCRQKLFSVNGCNIYLSAAFMHGNGLLSMAVLVIGMYHNRHSVQQMKHVIMILGCRYSYSGIWSYQKSHLYEKTSLIYTTYTYSYYDVYLFLCVCYTKSVSGI